MDVVTECNSYQRMMVEGFDADALLGVVKDARFEQRLLGGGEFRAVMQRLSFPGFSLDYGSYSLPVFASGSFGSQVVALALAVNGSNWMWANGQKVESGRLVFFAEDQELDVRPAPGHWTWCVLMLSREMLLSEARFRFGYEPTLPTRGWWATQRQPSRNIELIDTVQRTLAEAAGWTMATPAYEINDAGRILIAAFTDALMESMPVRLRRRVGEPMHVRHGLMIRRAEQFLEQRHGQEFSVAMLAAAIGIGERQLERIFRSAYGMGPCRWYQVARLNRARRMLRGATSGSHVTDIASHLGFGHLGRFSHDYRQLFGELPRDTLARHRLNPSRVQA